MATELDFRKRPPNPTLGIGVGVAAGLGFWYLSEASVPEKVDCSYLAAPATDLFALLGAMVCAYKGVKLNDPFIQAFGSAVIVIHAFQYLTHKA
jgi:hypothetical protein